MGLSLGIDRAPNQYALVGIDLSSFKPGGGARIRGKFSRNFGFEGSLSNQRDIASSAENKLQGVDQNGFPGSGLPGQTRQTVRGLDRQVLHDNEIFQI